MRMYVLKSCVNELILKINFIYFLKLKMVYVVPNERVFLETHYFYSHRLLTETEQFYKGELMNDIIIM